jgi:MFS family permease
MRTEVAPGGADVAQSSIDRSRLARLCVATLLHFTVMGIYMSALPLFITDELGGTRGDVGLVIGAFFVSAVSLRPMIGRRIDRWGRRPFLAGSPALIVVASLLFLTADSVSVAVLIRLIQGLAGGTFYTAAATVATDIAPRDRRAEIIVFFSLFLYGGIATGPAIGEWLATNIGFGATWVVAATLSGAAVLAALSLPETLSREERDLASPAGRWLHPAAIGPGLILLCAATAYSSIISFSPLYARDIGMDSSGGLYAAFALTILVVRIASRRLADRHGRTAVAAPGLILGACGMALLAFVQVPIAAYIGVAAYGSGFALAFPALLALTADRVAPNQRGAALASFTAFFDIGAGAGSPLVGYLAGASGFAAAFTLPTAACAIAALILLRRGWAMEERQTSVLQERE